MTTAATQPRATRKPVQLHVEARWLTPGFNDTGHGLCEIVSHTRSKPVTAVYDVQMIGDENNHLMGLEFTNHRSGDVYRVLHDADYGCSCDCADHVFRAAPAGLRCKHVVSAQKLMDELNCVSRPWPGDELRNAEVS